MDDDIFGVTRQYTASSAIELAGHGVGERSMIGVAIHLTVIQGRATFSDDVLADIAKRRKREEAALEAVIVTEEVADVLFLRLPEGLTLVGIVAQKRWEGEAGEVDFPVISDVAEAISRIPENYLLLLHPKRHQVLVEPSAEEMAAFQKELQKPRVLLGSLHTPAMTQSGQMVAVWAQIQTLEEAAMALDNGADGIFIVDFSDIAPFDSDVLEPLITLALLVGGGDLAVAGPIEACEALTLATHCRLTWILPDSDTDMIEVTTYLTEEITVREAENEPAAMPRLALWEAETGDETFWALDRTSLPTAWGLPPLRVVILDADPAQLADAVALGAVGIIVNPSAVAEGKDTIRELE
jgi:hypothetical protein